MEIDRKPKTLLDYGLTKEQAIEYSNVGTPSWDNFNKLTNKTNKFSIVIVNNDSSVILTTSACFGEDKKDGLTVDEMIMKPVDWGALETKILTHASAILRRKFRDEYKMHP